MFSFKPNYYLLLILLFAATLVFWKLGSHDLSEWDEARNGVNACEMYHNKDFVNLYYAHDLDTWNAKPPLMIWLIAICYKLFGFNEFALRLPSAISTILFFIIFYRLVAILENKVTAFLSCLVLLSCKAVIGFHVGISGDFDALLMLFLMLSAYHFIQYTDYGKTRAVYLAALFTGFAFYTKGTAALLFIPGLLLYALLKGKGKAILQNRHTWYASMLFLCIAGTWALLILLYGKTSDHSVYGTKNALEIMLVHDTYRRLTSSSFDVMQQVKPDYFFFFTTLDSRMNLWNYLFYISILIGVASLYRNRNKMFRYIADPSNGMALLSACITIPMAIILTFAVNKHAWYLAPFYSFLAFIIARGVMYLAQKSKAVYLMVIALFLFTVVRHFMHINSLTEELHKAQAQNKALLKNSRGIVIKDLPKQNVLLYLEWLDLPITIVPNASNIPQYSQYTFVGSKTYIADSVIKLGCLQTCFDEYCMVKIN